MQMYVEGHDQENRFLQKAERVKVIHIEEEYRSPFKMTYRKLWIPGNVDVCMEIIHEMWRKKIRQC